jgi:zinc protease
MTATLLALATLAQAAEERFTLGNGLTVIVRPIADAKQAAVVTLFSIGGDHDPEGRSGLAHLLEHLYVTAPAGTSPRRTVEEIFRLYPAGHNAQTGERYTVVASVVSRDRLADELRDAAARMADLRMEEEDLERERPRLLLEVGNMFGGIPALAARNQVSELVRPTPRGGRRGEIRREREGGGPALRGRPVEGSPRVVREGQRVPPR